MLNNEAKTWSALPSKETLQVRFNIRSSSLEAKIMSIIEYYGKRCLYHFPVWITSTLRQETSGICIHTIMEPHDRPTEFLSLATEVGIRLPSQAVKVVPRVLVLVIEQPQPIAVSLAAERSSG